MDKKGMTMSLTVIITIVVLLIVAVIIVSIVGSSGSNLSSSSHDSISTSSHSLMCRTQLADACGGVMPGGSPKTACPACGSNAKCP